MNVVVSAIIGAAGAVVGVLLGEIVNRLFKVTWGRWLSIVGVVVALSFSRQLSPLIDRFTWTASNTETAILSANPDLFRRMKSAVPDEYRLMVDNITAAVKAGADRNEVLSAGEVFVVEARRRYAGQLRFATDDDLRTMITMMIDLHRDVFTELGPSTCGRFAMEGGSFLVRHPDAKKFLPDLNKAALFFFETLERTISAPTPRVAATDLDYEALADAFIHRGAPITHLDIVSSGDSTNLEFCPALIEFMEAALTLSGEEGSRVRAELVVGAFEA